MTENENPVQQADPGEPDGSAAPAPSVEALQEALAEAEARAERFREEALRARAEMENFRKRVQRDVENAHKYGIEKLVNEMLPVKDSLELGLAAAAGAEGADSVREGIELTLKMLADALERLGVAEVDPGGQKFDPQYHQAINTETAAGAEPGTVVTVIQKGYLLQDRLLRPALVTVAARPEQGQG